MQISSLAPIAFLALAPVLSAQGGKGKVDFISQVLPILESQCFECHGPKEQEADLRFDTKNGLFVEDEEDWVIKPGNHKDSEFYIRITLPGDDEDIMPPEDGPMRKKDIEILRKWIDEGAHWPDDADDAIAKKLAGGAPKIEKLDLPTLSASQQAAEKSTMAAIAKAGGLAMRIASSSMGSEVNLSLLGQKADNAKLQLAKGLSSSLVRLNLARTKIDDVGLGSVSSFRQLRWLNLSNTGITDAGLGYLSGLSNLRYLNLYGTKVTDAGIAKLSGLKNLRKLFLWQTGATKAGAGKLKKALPDLMIDMGEYAAVLRDVKPAGKKAAAAINKKCPVTGRNVAAGKTSVFQGQVIGLCCDKCKKRFDKNPAKFIGKVAEFKPAKKDAVAINKKCPVTGRNVVASKTSVYQGQVIGLCCGKCKASFDKTPAKFIGKVKEFKATKGSVAANAKCPVSGESLAAGQVSSYQGKVIGFCCKNCKAKFDKSPGKYLAKLKDVFEK
jgi:YHS domain-containing protein